MNGPSPARRRLVLLFAVISLAALAVRLLHLAAIRPHPWWDLASIWAESDMHQNLLWARHLEAGDWLDRNTFRAWFDWQESIAPREVWSSWFGAHTYYQPPLYPYLLAVNLKLTDSLDAARVAQLALGAINCGLLALLAARLFGPAAGWLAGFGAATYAPFIFYDAELLRNTVVTTSQLGLLLALASRWYFVAGAVFAIAWLADSSIVVFAPLAALWVWWAGGKLALSRSGLRPVGLFALGAIVGVLPLCARNAAVGAPLLSATTRAPLAFIMGNAPDANPGAAYIPESTGSILRASGYGMAATMGETLRRYDGGYGALARKQWDKMKALWGAYELPDNPSFYYAARLSPVLRYGLRFLPVAALGLAGLCLILPRARRDPDAALLPLHLAACTGLFALTHVVSRYRLPLLISLIPLAGWALGEVLARMRAGRGGFSWRGPAILAAALAAAALLARTPPAGYGYNRPVEFVMVARLFEDRGQPQEAADELRSAARLSAQETAFKDHEASLWLQAGLTLARAGQHADAIESFRMALARDPEMGEAAEALALSEQALRRGGAEP